MNGKQSLIPIQSIFQPKAKTGKNQGIKCSLKKGILKKQKKIELKEIVGPDWSYEMSGYEMYWEKKAEELIKACYILFEAWGKDIEEMQLSYKENRIESYKHPTSLMDVAILLAGYAIENLLKGIHIARNPDLIKDGKLSPKISSSHKLLDLAKELAIELDEEEENFCLMATEWVLNHGRYPIPKSVSKMHSGRSISFSVVHVIDGLYKKLRDELHNSSRFYK